MKAIVNPFLFFLLTLGGCSQKVGKFGMEADNHQFSPDLMPSCSNAMSYSGSLSGTINVPQSGNKARLSNGCPSPEATYDQQGCIALTELEASFRRLRASSKKSKQCYTELACREKGIRKEKDDLKHQLEQDEKELKEIAQKRNKLALYKQYKDKKTDYEKVKNKYGCLLKDEEVLLAYVDLEIQRLKESDVEEDVNDSEATNSGWGDWDGPLVRSLLEYKPKYKMLRREHNKIKEALKERYPEHNFKEIDSTLVDVNERLGEVTGELGKANKKVKATEKEFDRIEKDCQKATKDLETLRDEKIRARQAYKEAKGKYKDSLEREIKVLREKQEALSDSEKENEVVEYYMNIEDES